MVVLVLYKRLLLPLAARMALTCPIAKLDKNKNSCLKKRRITLCLISKIMESFQED